ncbi:hypothetical protein [Minwuia sp.]|uniref:hypothetical protein n=1 Tax=Minwuia sp. TaxID=2493630 RepID=UPI003A91028B
MRWVAVFAGGFLAALLILGGAAAYGIWQYGGEAYREWAVLPFIPACQEYENPETADDFDFYRRVEGTPTREFWRYAIEELNEYPDFSSGQSRSIAIKNGRILVALRKYWKRRWPLSEVREHVDPERWFHVFSAAAAQKIYDDRVRDGAIETTSLAEFRVHRWRSNMRELPHPDECGFMEELIMKGGRFASE